MERFVDTESHTTTTDAWASSTPCLFYVSQVEELNLNLKSCVKFHNRRRFFFTTQ